MAQTSTLKEDYSPLYFLAALGAGGLAVSFFMYLNFLIPRPGFPMATADVLLTWTNANMAYAPFVLLALVGIVYFSYKHIALLVWNIRQFQLFKQNPAYKALKCSNGEVSLMAIPLTYAMSINVGFVLGATFVPGLWGVIEWLFPMALLAFLAVGVYALKLYSTYFMRLMLEGDFNPTANNNFSQLLAIFAFSMVGVGFAAPGAMSTVPLVSALGIFGAVFFTILAVTLALLKILFAMRDIFAHGIHPETSVSLWVMIPILTLLGITAIRVTFGVAHNFMGLTHGANWLLFLLGSTVLSLQLMFGWIGYGIMRRVDYFNTYIHGPTRSPVSFAIICPGVALFVFGFFFLITGLVANNIVSLYSPLFFALVALLAWAQWLTIRTFFTLSKKLL
jgi:hypothetical protein